MHLSQASFTGDRQGLGDRDYCIAGESSRERAPHYTTLPNTHTSSSEADCPRNAQPFRQVHAVVVGQPVHVLDARQVLDVFAVQTMRRGCCGSAGAH